MDYINYYNLEEYLFEKVGTKFRENGALSVEDFFCIVIWKANRSKTKIKRKLSSNGKGLEMSIKEIATGLRKTVSSQEKLKFMVKDWGFGLPMASAILTVLYPKEFTVYDYRVCGQLHLESIYSVRKYFSEFFPKVKAYAKMNGITLREADKELWGKSFREDLVKLVQSD